MTDWQLSLSLLIRWTVVHGRSQLVESFVWLIPSLCVKRGEKIKGSRENEGRSRWKEMKENISFLKNVWQPPNLPDELAQNVSKEMLGGRIIPLSSKVQNLIVFWTIYMIRIRFFGPGEFSESTSGGAVNVQETNVTPTTSAVISLDAGLHMDGVPALNLWDLVIEVLHSSNNVPALGNPSRD